MSVHDQPLVSIVTPVYNGEPFLRECIESVLAQTYTNWNYTIVNNCSKDGTLDIAKEYEKKDQRIRVSDNTTFLGIIANHNRAFSLIASDSRFCKVVSADDWLFPECIERMVDLAVTNPSVGLVGCYQLSGGGDKWYVRNYGLPYQRTVVNGREMCRLHTLGSHPLDVFGNPTSTLYRADLVRQTDAFYPNETAEADRSACFLSLQSTDYGFVHQVLSYERLHERRITTVSKGLNAYMSSKISDCLTYGPSYLTQPELESCVQRELSEYYRFLASSAYMFRDKAFWDYHKKKLAELHYPLDKLRLSKEIVIRLLDILLNPVHAIDKWRKLRQANQTSQWSP